MTLYRDQGVVLRTHKLGEADRIVVVATQAHGKVRAVAKGVRKTKSRFGSRLEPPHHVALLLYEGRGELETVSQVETLDHFRAIREDLDRLSQASQLLEAVDQVMQERETNVRLYQMLVNALRTLEAAPSPLLTAAFFWKLLSMEGYHPVIERCVACDDPDVELVAFDMASGGALCRSCRQGMPLSPEALGLLRRILGGGLAGALQVDESPATHEVGALATRALEHHLERRMRSIGVLDRG